MEFKIGDKIRCVQKDGLNNYLTVGKIYTVSEKHPNPSKYVHVINDGDFVQSYYNYRFELVGEEKTEIDFIKLIMDF